MTLGLTLVSSLLTIVLTLGRVRGVGGKVTHTGDCLGVGGGWHCEGDWGLGLEGFLLCDCHLITGHWGWPLPRRRTHVASTGESGHVLSLTGGRWGSKPHLMGHVGHLHTRHGTGTHLGPVGMTGDHGESLGPLGGTGVE